MEILIKIFRILIFLPICLLAIGLVDLGLWGLANLLILINTNVNQLLFLIIFIIFAGIVWNLFKMFSSLLTFLASKVSPIDWLGTITVSVISIINGICLIYIIWTNNDYSGWGIISAIIGTILILRLTSILVSGSSESNDDY